MKIRTSFVSNSSSSSFVLVVPQKTHEEVLSALTEDQREVVSTYEFDYHNFLGNDVVSLEATSYEDGISIKRKSDNVKILWQQVYPDKPFNAQDAEYDCGLLEQELKQLYAYVNAATKAGKDHLYFKEYL
jgi:hypothetical protein